VPLVLRRGSYKTASPNNCLVNAGSAVSRSFWAGSVKTGMNGDAGTYAVADAGGIVAVKDGFDDASRMGMLARMKRIKIPRAIERNS
jgi:hypothetical protein